MGGRQIGYTSIQRPPKTTLVIHIYTPLYTVGEV